MVTIKAVRTNNTTIEWTYDYPQQCQKFWLKLCETGRAPDTGDQLIRAYYFGPKNKPGDGPDKAWMS